ncbi:MAG: oligosaccharide flippase family protein [Candidatus Bathyarchaeia archaeon]
MTNAQHSGCFTLEPKMYPAPNPNPETQLGSTDPSSGNLTSAVAVSRGASYLTIQTIITSVAQALAFAILARLITPTEVGILAILSLIIALAQSLNGGAFSQAATTFIGELASDSREAASAVFYQSLRVTLLFSIPISVFVFVAAPSIASLLLGSVAQAGLFRVLAVDLLVFSGALPVAIGTLLGMKRFKEAATIGSAGIILRQCLVVLLIIFMRNLVGLVIGWILSDLAMFVAYAVFIIHVLGLPKKSFSLRKLISFSWPLSIGNVVNFAYSWFDRAILIAFVPLAALGVYNAALTAFGVLSGITGSVNNALLPAYSNIHWRGGLESCRRATWLASRYASLAIVPLSFGLLATAKIALTTFVGQAYVGGADSLAILSLFFALTAFGSVLGTMLVALSETRMVMWITVASVLLAVASAYVLLPLMGITGASVARGLVMVASLVLTIIVLKKKNAVSIDLETLWKTLVAGGLMAGVLVLVQMMFYSSYLLPAYMVLGLIVYLVTLRFLKAVREHDIELIHKYLGTRLGFVSKLLAAILIAK